MGRLFIKHYDDSEYSRVYTCKSCEVHLAVPEGIVSKSFNGRKGTAYLFSSVVNVVSGRSVDRELSTGRHSVADVFCLKCHAYVGWRYFKAFERDQKYKEGKILLERNLLRVVGWEMEAHSQSTEESEDDEIYS